MTLRSAFAPIFLALAAISACRPAVTPLPPRAFAVDVAATSGTITLDGWACPGSNPDWCGIPQTIQNKGTYGHADFPALAGNAPAMNFHIRANGYEPMDCVGSVPPGNATAAWDVPPNPQRYTPTGCPDHLTPSFPPARTGVVIPDGKAIRDGQGNFHAEGLTFFWAMQGMRGDYDRFLANVKFIATHDRPDYVRILAQVDWQGWEIDPNWPDYEAVLGRVIDLFYQYGMRVEITVLGSPYSNPVELAHRVARVTSTRPEKVIAIETWNEWSQNGGSISAMSDMARVFLAESGVKLVALSSDPFDPNIAAATAAVGATMGTIHPDRDAGDGDWRAVRQCFDAKDFRMIIDLNEPPGPNSSVEVMSDPTHLGMFRACTHQSGGAMWVFHVGDMVMGQRDPGHHRMPNIWQVGCESDNPVANTPENPCPYIVQALHAVRSVDGYIPDSVENWQKTAGNPNFAPQALKPDQAGWDVQGPTVNRAYAALGGTIFMQTLLGLKGPLHFTLTMPGVSRCHIQGLNPGTGELLSLDLNVGDGTVITGRDDGNTGYVLTGLCQ